eukprot:1136937-Pelagomonas_calceolata.AAC.1
MFLLRLLTREQSHNFNCCILDRGLDGGVDACLFGCFKGLSRVLSLSTLSMPTCHWHCKYKRIQRVLPLAFVPALQPHQCLVILGASFDIYETVPFITMMSQLATPVPGVFGGMLLGLGSLWASSCPRFVGSEWALGAGPV